MCEFVAHLQIISRNSHTYRIMHVHLHMRRRIHMRRIHMRRRIHTESCMCTYISYLSSGFGGGLAMGASRV